MGSGGTENYILKACTDYVILNEVKDLSGSTPSDSHTDLEILRFAQDDIIAARRVSFRGSVVTVGTLRLNREHNQTYLNYAEAEQGRPKVNLPLLLKDCLYQSYLIQCLWVPANIGRLQYLQQVFSNLAGSLF